MEDELVLVLDHADRNPQFHRPARLALRDPARVRLEDGEHLLLVRNPLSLQQTPVDLVDLASRVVDVAPDQAAFRFLDAFPDQCLDGPFGPLDQIPAQPQIRLHLLRRLLASPCRAHRIEPLLHPLAQMPVFAASLPPRVPPPLAPSPGSDTAPHPTVNPNRWDNARRSPPRTSHTARATARQAFFLATAWPLSTTSRPTSASSSGLINDTLSTIV